MISLEFRNQESVYSSTYTFSNNCIIMINVILLKLLPKLILDQSLQSHWLHDNLPVLNSLIFSKSVINENVTAVRTSATCNSPKIRRKFSCACVPPKLPYPTNPADLLFSSGFK